MALSPEGRPGASVCMLACGQPDYLEAAALSIRSILERTPFDVAVCTDRPGGFAHWREEDRVRVLALEPGNDAAHRSTRFLRKFEALRLVAPRIRNRWMLLLDADALFVRPTTERDIAVALGGKGLGMVEQPTITGSTMSRAGFLDVYRNHTMAWFGDRSSPPPLDRFRYFNSGVVLAETRELKRLVDWASPIIDGASADHDVAGEMIGDQDYFQYWVNNLHPGCCADLHWSWNHCEHWHDGFPRDGARILHFSNFCNGPNDATVRRMADHAGPRDPGVRS